MKLLIADDEALARARLRAMVEEIGGYQLVGEAANGEDALRAYREHLPEIVLLDIHMPGMDGLAVARELAAEARPPAVIFTTAYQQHALQAFEAHATGYLLKPIRKARLQEALQAAQRMNRSQLSAAEPEQPGARASLSVSSRGNIRLIELDDIFYLRAEQKYVVVRHTQGSDLLDESLKSLEEEFAERFIRVHRNALAARRYLEGLEKDALGRSQLRLRGLDERLEVSRRHLPDLRKLLRRGT